MLVHVLQILPAGPRLETERLFSESLPVLRLCLFDSSSSAEPPHTAETKWKTQLPPLMNRLTVWQEKQISFPESTVEQHTAHSERVGLSVLCVDIT